jgi:hypothetical protein
LIPGLIPGSKWTSDHLSPERHQREFYQLQMLSGEWYPDDRKTKQKGEDQMHQRGVQSTAQQPDNITKKIDASHGVLRRYDPLAKWPKNQPCQLKTLQPERNSDDRQAKHETAEDIPHRGKESTTDQPYKVSYKIHWLKIPIF